MVGDALLTMSSVFRARSLTKGRAMLGILSDARCEPPKENSSALVANDMVAMVHEVTREERA